jgi:hypothetical protein
MTTVEFDQRDRDMPSVAVVRAVADELDASVDDIECTLQNVVDPKALNRLFSTAADGTPRTPGDAAVRFTFCECAVVVHSDGYLTVTRTGTELKRVRDGEPER